MPRDHEPRVLWEEWLPTGDTAKVIVCPGEESTVVVLHWNNNLRLVESCPTLARAEERGRALQRAVLNAELGPPPRSPSVEPGSEKE